MTSAAKRFDGLRSPCIDNCCLDENDICLGCARSLEEITGWSNLSTTEKSAVLTLCLARQEQRALKLRVLQQKQP